MNKKICISIVLIVISAIVIFNNSSASGEISNRRSLNVAQIINTFRATTVFKSKTSVDRTNGTNVIIKEETVKKLNVIIRKSAHFLEYLILAMFASITMDYFKVKIQEKISLVLFFTLLIAVFDEFNQSFVPGRTSSVRDVVIDFFGSSCGLLLLLLFNVLRNIKIKN